MWAWCAKILQIWLTFHQNKMCLAKGKESKRQQQAGWWWCVFECVCTRGVLQALMCLLHPWKGRKTPIKATHTQKESNRTGLEPSALSSCFVFCQFLTRAICIEEAEDPRLLWTRRCPVWKGHLWVTEGLKSRFWGVWTEFEANLYQKRWVYYYCSGISLVTWIRYFRGYIPALFLRQVEVLNQMGYWNTKWEHQTKSNQLHVLLLATILKTPPKN